ncbi:MAG: hypothetical protein ACREB5_10565 [Sphingomonadaceae bacterium]
MTAVTLTKGGWVRKDASGRTYQPVRPQSQMRAPHEYEPRRISQHQANRQKMALRELADETRVPGKRRGSDGNISRVGERVYAYLVDWQVKTGRVFPSMEMIAKAIGSTSRVVGVEIRKLARLGLLAWDRRCVPTGRPLGEPGPQVEQTSNFYFMAVPNVIWKKIASWQKRRKARADVEQESDRQRKDRMIAAMKRYERSGIVKAARTEHEARKSAQRARNEAWWSKVVKSSPAVAALDAASRSASKRDVPEG